MLGLCTILSAFFFSSRRRHTRCALVTGVQTCALPIWRWMTFSLGGWPGHWMIASLTEGRAKSRCIGLDTGLACTVFPETRIAEPEDAVAPDDPEQVGEREAVAEQPRSAGRPDVAIEIGNPRLRLRKCGPH